MTLQVLESGILEHSLSSLPKRLAASLPLRAKVVGLTISVSQRVVQRPLNPSL